MIEIFNGLIHTFGSTSALKAVISYEKKRNGADMLYRFNYKILITNRSGEDYGYGSYVNNLQAVFTLNGVNVWTQNTQSSATSWAFDYTSDWFTVSNKTIGTTPFKFTIKDTQTSGWCNYTSTTFNLAIDPAGSVLNPISNFNIENSISVSITKYSSNFTDSLVISYGSTTIKTINNILNGATISFTSSELSTIYSLMSTVKFGTFTFTLTSKSGSTTIGTSTQKATGNITNANPTFTSSQITYLDSNITIVGITGNNQHIVRNLSNLKVSYTGATGNKGATINKYEITFNGATQTKTSSATIDYGKVNLSNDSNVVIKAIDSRGNYTQISKTIKILDWVNPTAIISAKRVNNYEDDTKIKVQVSISSVNSKNSIKNIKCRYKKTSDTAYGDYEELTNNIETTCVLDKAFAWNLQILIEDQFGSTTYNLVVAKGYPIMFFDINKIAVGVNCFPSNNGVFEIGGNTNIDGDLKIKDGKVIKSGKYLYEDDLNAFQTNVLNGNNGNFKFKAIRSAITDNNDYPLYSTGMAWSGGDTHGLFLVNYRDNNAEVYFGGGNADKINWIKKMAFKEDLDSYQLKETALYNHNTGTTGNITLSQSAANFTYLEFFYYKEIDGKKMFSSTKVYQPNGKYVALDLSGYWDDSSTMQTLSKCVYISGTSIGVQTDNSAYGNMGDSGSFASAENQVYITRVVGYK